MEDIIYNRDCPICSRGMEYKNKRKFQLAIKKNTGCLSCSKKGEKNPIYGLYGKDNPNFGQIRESIRGENSPNRRDDLRKKVSERMSGKPSSMKGKHHTKESIDKISKSNIGKKRSEETCEKIRQNTLKQLENGKNNNPYCTKLKYKESELHYQGSYELDFLNKYSEIFNIKNGKTIYYNRPNGKKAAYISDFYIEKLNLIIEIKSTYTIKKEIDDIKKEYTIKSGYNYIMILDKNYEQFIELYNLMLLSLKI